MNNNSAYFELADCSIDNIIQQSQLVLLLDQSQQLLNSPSAINTLYKDFQFFAWIGVVRA